tara:strand:+ start:399 stop:599 length:201 start_codon:yes stop_codon:yes gene_type:complete
MEVSDRDPSFVIRGSRFLGLEAIADPRNTGTAARDDRKRMALKAMDPCGLLSGGMVRMWTGFLSLP